MIIGANIKKRHLCMLFLCKNSFEGCSEYITVLNSVFISAQISVQIQLKWLQKPLVMSPQSTLFGNNMCPTVCSLYRKSQYLPYFRAPPSIYMTGCLSPLLCYQPQQEGQRTPADISREEGKRELSSHVSADSNSEIR